MVVEVTEEEQPGAAEPLRRSREESEVESGVLGAPRMLGRSSGGPQPGLDLQGGPLERSRRTTGNIGTTGASGTTRRPELSLSDVEIKQEKKSGSIQISKSNTQFHSLFKEVKRDELLRQRYTCALQREMLYQGKLFVSENWICFHSRVFGRITKISIPVSSVTLIKKTKTALLVPNALVIQTTHYQHVFVSFLSRNTTFKLLKSLCRHLEVESCSFQTSSCESSFSPSSLPLDLVPGFSGLDQVDQHRSEDLMESSSSGSQTSDSDRTTDLRPLQDVFLRSSIELNVKADVHLQNAAIRHSAATTNASPDWTDEPPPPAGSLLLLLLLYLLLVCVLLSSSCFLSVKIVSLEQRLNALLTARGETTHTQSVGGQRSPEEVRAELYRELTSNLLKLEKVQRNLRKLLEET